MSSKEPTSQPESRPRKSVWRRHVIASSALLVLIAAVASITFYFAIGRTIAAPNWVREQVMARASDALGTANLQFDALDFVVDKGMKPRMRMSNVQLTTQSGAEIVAFAEVRAGLSLERFLQGQALLADISVSGVFAQLRRQLDGSVLLSGGLDLSAPTQQAATFAQLIESVDAVLALPALSALTRAEVQALTLQVEDLRSSRRWTIDGGRVRLNRDGEVLQLNADLALLSGGQGVATLEANYESRIGASEAHFGVTIADVDAGDIAALAPPFAWLDVLRAPISGSMRGGITDTGTFEPLHATLTISEGVLQPTDATRPVPFSSARSYFSYDPNLRILTFDELSVRSAWITGQMVGQTFLGVSETGVLEDLVGQFRTSTLTANPNNVYEEAVSIDSAEMDFQLTLSPFRLNVGQAFFRDKGQTLHAYGTLAAEPQGWSYSVDAQMDGLMPDRLLTLWPDGVKPRTRKWISENISAGSLRNLDFALRGTPQGPPNVFIGFAYQGAELRYARNLPLITDASGTASLFDNRFVATVDKGHVEAPQGGTVDIAGTSFIIPDVTAGPGAPGVVRLETKGSVTAMLSLLDQPPLSLMQKAGRVPTVADGRLQVAGTLAMPLRRGLKLPDFTFSMSGTASDVVSTTLIEGRRLEAGTLRLDADNLAVNISGPGTLDGVAFDVVWTKPLGQPAQPSTLAGTLEVSERTIEAFRIGLPAGMVTGGGSGRIALELPVGGGAPVFQLESDMTGLRLSAPPINWSKAPQTVGDLFIAGVLGPEPRIDLLRVDAPGLSASGSITLAETGGLERARFDRVQVGAWLQGSVDLEGRGAGAAPAVVVRGGTLDLRAADFGGTSGGDAASRTGAAQGERPLALALERLQITDAIALTDVVGTFNLAGGLDGAFGGRVNGGAPIRGFVLPQNGRSAIRITSDDAGGVAGSAGILKQARGGALSLTLLPVGDASFDGTLNVADTSIQDAPAIAALLNTLSVVGILDQMQGGGIRFNEVEAVFRLTPSTMILTRASAVGPSMGLSMDGTFDVANANLDMRGVISPIYVLNRVGSIFTRKGEGLIGFNYTLSGPSSAPQVTVNPMSALTPGVFRELFRAAPPEIPELEGAPPAPALPEAFVPETPDTPSSEQLREERQQRLDDR
ncbi:DUF3971 domain-containing protein [Tateyamaria pelophila]|uniref:DUF3971 domain-containing protein n=1 Tax=Tateyamaria pelophila TaxID=328415 RepID=UPI001CBC09D0|nr:DUF3971 domain-containing protein [Tateyamaria pelophila]